MMSREVFRNMVRAMVGSGAMEVARGDHAHHYATFNEVYPIGSIYASINNVPPSIGTWVSFTRTPPSQNIFEFKRTA